MLPLTPPETQKLAAWEPAVYFVHRIARIWTSLLAIWGVIQQMVYHHQSFSSVDKIKRAIVKSMAETTVWRSHCQFITFITFLFTVNVIRQMAPLFSKVDSNKLRHDVQHEESVISAKFGKDLFNISKVIGRKKVAQFFCLTVYITLSLKCTVFRYSSSKVPWPWHRVKCQSRSLKMTPFDRSFEN